MSAWLSKASELIKSKGLKQAVHVYYKAGGVALALMMFVTAIDVVGRYILSRPLYGAYDMTEYLMTIHIAGGWAICALMKGHVNVDVLVMRLPQRARAILDTITGLISIVIFSWASWRLFILAKAYYDLKFGSQLLYIPSYPFVIVVSVGIILLTLVLLTEFFDNLSKAVKK